MLIYEFTLAQVAVVLGLLYLAVYGWMLAQPARARQVLQAFPRNYPAGLVLGILVTAWMIWLVQTADLMEYTPHRTKFAIGFLVLGIASMVYLKEFLVVRAGGVLALFVAKIMLDAAFLRDEPSRFVITLLAYAFIIKGMVMVASPYLARDMMEWCFAREVRQRALTFAGLGLALLLLILGIFVY
jgi:hypothetical protein